MAHHNEQVCKKKKKKNPAPTGKALVFSCWSGMGSGMGVVLKELRKQWFSAKQATPEGIQETTQLEICFDCPVRQRVAVQMCQSSFSTNLLNDLICLCNVHH